MLLSHPPRNIRVKNQDCAKCLTLIASVVKLCKQWLQTASGSGGWRTPYRGPSPLDLTGGLSPPDPLGYNPQMKSRLFSKCKQKITKLAIKFVYRKENCGCIYNNKLSCCRETARCSILFWVVGVHKKVQAFVQLLL